MTELFLIFWGIFGCFGIVWISWSVGWIYGYSRGFQKGFVKAVEEFEKNLGRKE